MANGKQKNLIVPARRAAFAERIKVLRAAAGFTQTKLARRADIDRSYYAEVEAGLPPSTSSTPPGPPAWPPDDATIRWLCSVGWWVSPRV